MGGDSLDIGEGPGIKDGFLHLDPYPSLDELFHVGVEAGAGRTEHTSPTAVMMGTSALLPSWVWALGGP